MTVLEEPTRQVPTAEGSVAAGRVRRSLRSYLEIRRTPYGLAPIVIFVLIGLFERFDGQVFFNGAPDIVKHFNVNVNGIIVIVVWTGFLALFAGLAVGWYGDRHRRLPILGIGTILSGLAAAATGFGRTNLTMGLPRVVDEAFYTGANVPEFSLLADYYPAATRGRVFALRGAVLGVGTILSLPLSGLMIERLGFRTAFLICGIPIMVLGGLALVVLREPTRGYFERVDIGLAEDLARVEEEPQSFGEAWRATFAVRTVRRLFLSDVVSGFPDILGLFLIFLLSDHYGLDAFHRGLVLALPFVFSLAGAVLAGTLLDNFARTNPGRVLTVFGLFRLLVAVSWGVIAFQPRLGIVAAVLCLQYFGGSLIGPATNAVYSQVVPASIRTQGLQVAALSGVPAFLVGAPFYGALLVRYGYSTTFGWGAPFIAVGALISATAGRFFDFDRRNAQALAIANEEWRRAKGEGRDKLLVCRGVDVSYDGVQVLFGVDFDVEEGEIIAVLGTNGAGKSTLLRAISGLQEAAAGAIVFSGRDITHMPPHEVAQRHVILMPGGRGLFPGLSVRENLLLGGWLSDDPDEIKQGLSEVFEIFPLLADRLDAPAATLSGGQQQQLSLAQAFLARPRLLMIDELSLGLAPSVVQELLEAVRRIRDRGVTVIVVEQSVNVALNLAERAIFMEKGEVRFFGSTADLLSRPDILRAVYVKGTGGITAHRPTRAEALGAAPQAVLEVAGIVKTFGGVTALDDVRLTLNDGEVLGLIGPNGSGKTTLLDVISGYQLPDRGVVRYEGVDITLLSPEERARRHLIRRFQDARLFPSLTVFETLLVALEQRLEVRSAILGAVAMRRSRRAERRLAARADRLIELLGLEAYRDKFVKELSTGLRRIVDLACVLATEPKVLLLDEPSSGIAQAEAEGLGPLLRRVRYETGCSMLIIEHDMPLITAVSDELVALDLGTVLRRGSPAEVLEDERVIESYLGGSEAAIRRSGSLI